MPIDGAKKNLESPEGSENRKVTENVDGNIFLFLMASKIQIHQLGRKGHLAPNVPAGVPLRL